RRRIKPGDTKTAYLSSLRIRPGATNWRRSALPAGLQHGTQGRQIGCLRCSRLLFLCRYVFNHPACAHNALAQFHPRKSAGYFFHASCDHIAFFMFGNVLIQAGRDHLLDAETHVALCAVHVEHLRFHRLPDLEHVLGMIDPFFRADFADVNHSLNALCNLHEGAELGNAHHWPFDHRANTQILCRLDPGITQRLFQSQRNAPLTRVHSQDDRFHGLAGFHSVTRLPDFSRPRHFRNMDQPLNAGFEFHKCAKVGEPRYRAAHALASLVFFYGGVPGMRLKLLHTQRDAPLVGINLEHLDFDLLPHGQHVCGFADAAPGNVADVQQAIHFANVDKRPVISQAAYHAAHSFAFPDLRVAALFVGALFFFGNHAAVHHYVFICNVQLGDAAAHFLPDELFHLSRIAHSATRSRHERADSNIHT